MLSTLFLAATLAQVGSSGGFPSTSDTGIGSMGTPPMGNVIPATDPARDRGPMSSDTTSTSGTTGMSGGSSKSTPSGSSGTGSTGAGSTSAGTETESETSGRVSGGGTGTTGDSSTNGGTNSARPLR
jgi:hypothetical protein